MEKTGKTFRIYRVPSRRRFNDNDKEYLKHIFIPWVIVITSPRDVDSVAQIFWEHGPICAARFDERTAYELTEPGKFDRMSCPGYFLRFESTDIVQTKTQNP